MGGGGGGVSSLQHLMLGAASSCLSLVTSSPAFSHCISVHVNLSLSFFRLAICAPFSSIPPHSIFPSACPNRISLPPSLFGYVCWGSGGVCEAISHPLSASVTLPFLYFSQSLFFFISVHMFMCTCFCFFLFMYFSAFSSL